MASPENDVTMNPEQPVMPAVDANGMYIQQPAVDANGMYVQQPVVDANGYVQPVVDANGNYIAQPPAGDMNGIYAQQVPVMDASGVVQPFQPVAYTPDVTTAYPSAPLPDVMYTAPAYVPAYVPETPTPAASSANAHPPAPVLPPLTQEEYRAYLVTPEAPWPPPIFVKRNVGAEERFYLDNRWYSQWTFFDRKATENKNKYHRLQMIIGVGSVIVPVLVGISPTNEILRDIFYITTVCISLLVAACAAVENIYKYGENWRSYRQAAEELQQEKSLYDVKAGRYAGNKEPFIRFAERCEEVIAKQNGQFMQTVEKQQAQADQQNAEMLDKYRAEGQGQLTNFSTGGLYTSPTGGMFMATTDVASPMAMTTTPVQDTGSAG